MTGCEGFGSTRSVLSRSDPSDGRLPLIGEGGMLAETPGISQIRCRSERRNMNEVIFIVEEAQEGGYTARALGESIFNEGESPKELEDNVRDAVRCHFDPGREPKVIRLHFVREELITL